MLELNFDPFPVLETERLILRRITMEDAKDFFVLRTDEDVMKYIGRPKPNAIKEVEELINKMNDNTMRIQWAVALKEKAGIIGTIGYHRIEKEHYRAEIGYMIHPEYWNKGITSEAMKTVINFGFNEMNLHSIEADINPDNAVSKKLLMKFNFIREGYFKENYFFDGEFFDTEVYSLLKPIITSEEINTQP